MHSETQRSPFRLSLAASPPPYCHPGYFKGANETWSYSKVKSSAFKQNYIMRSYNTLPSQEQLVACF